MGEKVGFGAIVSYELTGGRIVAHLAGAASMNEFPLEVVAVYGKDLTLDSVQMYYGSFIAPPLSEQEIKSMMEKGFRQPAGPLAKTAANTLWISQIRRTAKSKVTPIKSIRLPERSMTLSPAIP